MASRRAAHGVLVVVMVVCLLSMAEAQPKKRKKQPKPPKRRVAAIVKDLEQNMTTLWNKVDMLSQPVHVHVHGEGHLMDNHHFKNDLQDHDDHDHDEHDHDYVVHHHHDYHHHFPCDSEEDSSEEDSSEENSSEEDGDDKAEDKDMSEEQKDKMEIEEEERMQRDKNKLAVKGCKRCKHGKADKHGGHNHRKHGHHEMDHDHHDKHHHEDKDGDHHHDDHHHHHDHEKHHHHQDNVQDHKDHDHKDGDHHHEHEHEHMHHGGHGTHVHIHLHTATVPVGDVEQVKPRLHEMPPELPKEYLYARCNLVPNGALPGTDKIRGSVHLRQMPGGPLEVRIIAGGFPIDRRLPEVSRYLRGMHGHTLGDTSNNCKNQRGHYNPQGVNHGGPYADVRHPGDFGNMVLEDNGSLRVSFNDTRASLFGHHSLLGRGIVIHEGEDDLGLKDTEASRQSGNAGGRVACCAVVASPEPAAVWL